MTRKQRIQLCIGIIFFACAVIVALVTFGLTPYPRDFMRAWYEPWRTETVVHGVPTIPHKPVGHDVFRQIYPYKALSVDILRNGKLPLWNPYNGAGQPLFASGVHGILNPFMLEFFVTHASTAWTILYVGQFVCIALAFIVYAGSIHLSPVAALISCLLLLSSGFVISNSLFATYLYSYAGLPLLLWCIEMIVRGNRRGFILFPFVVAWTVLTGFPQLTMYIFLLTGSYALYRCRNSTTHRLWFWASFVFTGCVGLGMSAVQIVPMYELYHHAAITTESSAFIFRTFLMPYSHIFSVLIPNFFGNPSTYNYWGYADYVETAASIGSVAIFFAILSWLLSKKATKPFRIFFTVVLGVSFLIAFRWVGTEWLYRLPIPVLTTGVPSRVMGIVTFALAILAGLGVDSYRANQKSKHIQWLAIGVWGSIASITAVVFFLNAAHVTCSNTVITACFSIAFRNSLFELLVFTAGAIFIVGTKMIPFFHRGQLFSIGVVLLVLGSGTYNAYKFVPLMRGTDLMPSHPLLSHLSTYKTERIGYLGVVLPTDLATHYRFYDTNYYNPLYIKRYGELVSYVNTGDRKRGITRSDVNIVSDATVSTELSFRRDRFWDITGTALLVTKNNNKPQSVDQTVWHDAQWNVTKRSTALPRVYLVDTVIVEPDSEKILSLLFSPEVDIHNTAFVEESVERIHASSMKIATGSATIDSYIVNSIHLNVNTSENSFLVLSDNYYSGWKARVDGVETKVYRTNYTFRGVEIPKGAHTVEFYYDPFSFRLGLMISIISFASILVFGISVWYGKIKL